MSRMQTPSLVEFLRAEAHRLDSTIETLSEPTRQANEVELQEAIRVPLELDGAIWSAVVTEVEEDLVHLVVDEEAIGAMEDRVDAAIHYQPDNCDMQRTCGRITALGRLSHDHVAVDFRLSAQPS